MLRMEKRMIQKVLEILSGLSLLVLISSLEASAQAPGYQVLQPESVSGEVGGSIIFPCSFSYPQWLEPLQEVRVYWRINNFHGDFIYNHSEGFTRQDYRGRISLVGDPLGKKTGSIQIRDLRESDRERYFCRVRVTGNNGRIQQWQNHPGTELRVSAVKTSTLTATTGLGTTSTVTLDMEDRTSNVTLGVDVDDSPRSTWQFHRADVVILATVISVLKVGISLAVALCFHWCRCDKQVHP